MRMESATMRSNGEFRFPYFLVGLGRGAIGGPMSALLGRKETRDFLRERSRNSLDYLNQQAGKCARVPTRS